jgi:FkbM family methyltransferase
MNTHQEDLNNYIEFIKKSNLHNIEYIVEVGSLDGNDSLFFKEVFPSANVYAIEGLPDNYNKFLKNKTTIKTYNLVITDHIGETDYYIKNINGIHGIYDRGIEYGDQKIKLPCITLDKFCEENNIPKIDVLKIDVEGATYDVLMGMTNILPNVSIMHIETETHEFFKNQKLHNEVENFLINSGFELLYTLKTEITPQKYQCDTIWINQKIT